MSFFFSARNRTRKYPGYTSASGFHPANSLRRSQDWLCGSPILPKNESLTTCVFQLLFWSSGSVEIFEVCVSRQTPSIHKSMDFPSFVRSRFFRRRSPHTWTSDMQPQSSLQPRTRACSPKDCTAHSTAPLGWGCPRPLSCPRWSEPPSGEAPLGHCEGLPPPSQSRITSLQH